MNVDTTQYHESSITRSYPWGFMLRADGALCPDGVRRVAYPSTDGVADTWFSIPARVRITRDGSRYTVAGYVTVQSVNGWDTPTPDDPATVHFRPYLYRQNGHLLASDYDLCQYVRSHPDGGPYVDEAWGEMTRRGLYLVYNPRAPHGRAIYSFRTGDFLWAEHDDDERRYYR